MDNLTHIGLDVHKEAIAGATLRPGAVDCDERVIPNTPEAIRKLLSRHSNPSIVRTCYEAGPTGCDTHRLIASLGIACDVIAPSLIPKRAGLRVKTDRIDAKNLARLHRAGELASVRVPTPAEEAVRDLIRVREDLKCDRRIARQRMKSFLLRHGKRYAKPRADWSWRFGLWLTTQPSVTLCENLIRVPSGRQAPARLRRAVQIRGYQHGRAPIPCARPLALILRRPRPP